MTDLSGKNCLFIDNGLFISIAKNLSKKFGDVFYWSPWSNAFPKSNSALIGVGVEGITRVNDIWMKNGKYPGMKDIDLVVCPDVYSGDLQLHLVEDCGKRVWGGRMGEELELYRDDAKELFRKLKLPVSPYKVVTGLDNLRSYLKEHERQWVKCNIFRGDFETFYAENYNNVEPFLDGLEHNLGAKKKITQFIVEDSLDDCIETGCDLYNIDGQYPSKCISGIEIKDLGYLAHFGNYSRMPKEITGFNEAIAPTLKKYGYRGFMSTEIRVTKKERTPYMIDFCARAGSPPSELYQNMFSNLAEIIWHGADGEMVDPICKDEWGVEVMLHAQWADQNWQNVQFPKEIRDNVKLRNLAVIDDEYYAVPQSVGLPEIGAVVASDKTMQGAIDKVKGYCDQISGYYIECHTEALDKAQEELDKLKEMGITL